MCVRAAPVPNRTSPIILTSQRAVRVVMVLCFLAGLGVGSLLTLLFV